MDLLFVGGGGHFKDLLYLSEADKYFKWNVIGYLDDDASLPDSLGPVSSLPVFLDRYPNLFYSISINSSDIRNRIDVLYGQNSRSANLIHETAVIGSNCSYKNGITMGPYSVLTTGVELGKHTHINSCASINQNSKLGDYCTVSPGARICGDIKIGDTTSIGAGATIINFKTVGSNCVLGAGTVVVRDIPDRSVVVGVPGKVIKTTAILD